MLHTGKRARRVILIRHGRTESNHKGIHQSAITPLSEHGLKQAEQLALRLAPAQIDRIYASPMTRAQQTAQKIGESMSLSVQTVEELREQKRPSELVGKHHDDPNIQALKKAIEENFHDPDWHYSDEENFADLAGRANRVRVMMEKETVQDILLVSHGYFICMFVAVVLFGDELTSRLFEITLEKLHFTNTGITTCEYSKEDGWSLVTVNDTTHLEAK